MATPATYTIKRIHRNTSDADLKTELDAAVAAVDQDAIVVSSTYDPITKEFVFVIQKPAVP